jgi:membrane-anchored protein YejM (alkaline phosphatase superfamily)
VTRVQAEQRQCNPRQLVVRLHLLLSLIATVIGNTIEGVTHKIYMRYPAHTGLKAVSWTLLLIKNTPQQTARRHWTYKDTGV